MKIIDISMPIHPEMMVYKNKAEKIPKITATSDLATGGSYESELTMNLHTGTHIDMPLHMTPGGADSNSLDLSSYISDCMVLDLTQVENKITAADLQKKSILPKLFILLKTRNSFTEQFDPGFVYLDATGAKYLTDKGAVGVGIDALGIERSQPEHETHKILMNNEIAIIEGLRLADVTEGTYHMIALPLRINNVEALPARVILIQ